MIPTMILLGLVLGVGVLAFQVLVHTHLGERLHVHSHPHRTGRRQAPRHLRR